MFPNSAELKQAMLRTGLWRSLSQSTRNGESWITGGKIPFSKVGGDVHGFFFRTTERGITSVYPDALQLSSYGWIDAITHLLEYQVNVVTSCDSFRVGLTLEHFMW